MVVYTDNDTDDEQPEPRSWVDIYTEAHKHNVAFTRFLKRDIARNTPHADSLPSQHIELAL